MFFDEAGIIFGAAGHGDEAGLFVSPHNLPIQKVAGAFVLDQKAVADEAVEVFSAFGVNCPIAGRDFGRPVNFRFADAEETAGAVDCGPPRFFAGERVVGKLANPRRQAGLGAQRSEGFYNGHKVNLARQNQNTISLRRSKNCRAKIPPQKIHKKVLALSLEFRLSRAD